MKAQLRTLQIDSAALAEAIAPIASRLWTLRSGRNASAARVVTDNALAITTPADAPAFAHRDTCDARDDLAMAAYDDNAGLIDPASVDPWDALRGAVTMH